MKHHCSIYFNFADRCFCVNGSERMRRVKGQSYTLKYMIQIRTPHKAFSSIWRTCQNRLLGHLLILKETIKNSRSLTVQESLMLFLFCASPDKRNLSTQPAFLHHYETRPRNRKNKLPREAKWAHINHMSIPTS